VASFIAMTRALGILAVGGLLAVCATLAIRREASRGPPDPAGAPPAVEPRRLPSGRRIESAAFGGDGAGTIRVALAASRDGAPVEGVRVDAVAFGDPGGGRVRVGGTSGPDGAAVLKDVRAGPVWVLAGGGARYCVVEAGETTAVALTVPEASAAVVEVVGPGGDPVAGAAVWVSAPGSHELGAVLARTGGDGRVRLAGVPSGRCVAACAAGLAWSERAMVEQEARAVRLVLGERGRVLRGQVVGPAGGGVAGAWVGCRRIPADRGPPVIEAVTDQDGAFELAGAGPGEWTIEAWREGLAPASGRVAAGSGDPPGITLALAEGVALAGRVTDGARGLARVRVAVRSPDAIGRPGETMTSADGSFRIANLPRGRLEAQAGYLAGDAIVAAIDAGGEGAARWDPVLGPDRVLAGVVTDERGAGRPFVRVRAAVEGSREGWMAECVADRAGRFEIAGVPAPVVIEVDVPEWEGTAAARVEAAAPGLEPLVIVVAGAARPSAWVEARVLGPEGNPAAGAVVTASRVPGPPAGPQEARAGPDGVFRLGPLSPGAYLVETVAPSGARLPLLECSVGAGEMLDLGDLSFGREGFLKALVDERGTLGGLGSLEVFDRLGRPVGRLRPVAGFALSGPLAPGAYVLRAGGRVGAAAEVPFTIVDGETTTVEFP
jgi:hypothetical protein